VIFFFLAQCWLWRLFIVILLHLLSYSARLMDEKTWAQRGDLARNAANLRLGPGLSHPGSSPSIPLHCVSPSSPCLNRHERPLDSRSPPHLVPWSPAHVPPTWAPLCYLSVFLVGQTAGNFLALPFHSQACPPDSGRANENQVRSGV
jgi:hypothetical protein